MMKVIQTKITFTNGDTRLLSMQDDVIDDVFKQFSNETIKSVSVAYLDSKILLYKKDIRSFEVVAD